MWWTGAVFYQIYVRSFADASGDGVGDLRGITDRLAHLAELGVDAIWLTPFYPSPMADHGYDVSDPRGVDPLFGDLGAFDTLLTRAHDLGLRVTIDLVPNHTSDRHEWFQAARAGGPNSAARSRYFFRDGRGIDGSEPPNNWPSTFGGPAWTRLPDGQWYLHLFAPEQPDLNWSNPDVAADLDQTMRFWLDRGVDGFRIDVAHGMAKPAGLPDLSPEVLNGVLARTEPDDPRFDNDGVHEVHRGVRRTLDDYPGVMAVGEIWVDDDERLSRYVRPDELHLAFNFRLLQSDWNASELREAIEHSLRSVAGTGTPACWVLSNHDRPRHVTRYGGGELGLRRARAAALLQLALPGVVYIYNGDELGLPDVDLPDEVLQDPIWERSGHQERGRDGSRVPLPWAGTQPPYDFSPEPFSWLPPPEGWGGLTVQAQREDSGSTLNLYRRALRIRRTWRDRPAMSPGAGVRWLGLPASALGFVRQDGVICVVNAGSAPISLPAGDLLLTSGPLTSLTAREDNGLALPPDTAAWLTSI
ncbi:MAG: glycoside hydrolase family 13 protein [Actinomycetota bacterium]|nr:glycoside hydrolase family 13 protein [Actinomycetota bacterium]